MAKKNKHNMGCYRVETPSGKKYTESLDIKQVKNLRHAEFKVKSLRRKC